MGYGSSCLQLKRRLWTHMHSHLAACLDFDVHAGSPHKLLFVRIFGPVGKALGFKGLSNPE